MILSICVHLTLLFVLMVLVEILVHAYMSKSLLWYMHHKWSDTSLHVESYSAWIILVNIRIVGRHIYVIGRSLLHVFVNIFFYRTCYIFPSCKISHILLSVICEVRHMWFSVIMLFSHLSPHTHTYAYMHHFSRSKTKILQSIALSSPLFLYTYTQQLHIIIIVGCHLKLGAI